MEQIKLLVKNPDGSEAVLHVDPINPTPFFDYLIDVEVLTVKSMKFVSIDSILSEMNRIEKIRSLAKEELSKITKEFTDPSDKKEIQSGASSNHVNKFFV